MSSADGFDDDLMGGTLAVEGQARPAAPLPFTPAAPRSPAPSHSGPPAAAPPALPFVAGAPSAIHAIHASAAGVVPPARVEMARDLSAAGLAPASALTASNGAASSEDLRAVRLQSAAGRDEVRAPSAPVELLWVDRERYAEPSTRTPAAEGIVDDFLDTSETADKLEAVALRSLGKGVPVSGSELRDRYGDALQEGRLRYVALVEGELELRFDPLQSTRTLVALTAQLATVDARIRAAHEAANAPGADVARALASGHELRLREALTHQPRETRAFVESHAERALLEGRSYETRTVLGGPHAVAWLLLNDKSVRLPMYVPDQATPELPLLKRFGVRAIVEVRARQDSTEPASIALRLLALGRLVTER